MNKKKKALIICFLSFGVVILLIGGYFLTKFKNATIELGNEISISDFIRYGSIENVNIDLSKVNKDKVGEYDVKLKYLFFKYGLKLKIQDTLPPEIEVQNIYKQLGYKVDVNDFIIKKEDQSEFNVEIIDIPELLNYGDYSVNIIAKDIYNNETRKECTLSIGWVKKEVTIEVGNDIKIADLVYDIKDKDTISQKDLDEINKKREGTYFIKSNKDGSEIEIKIEKTKDITPPELVLKKVTIYEGKKVGINDFISKVSDKGSKVTTNMLSTIDFKKIGKQVIKIEASDEDNNKTVRETELNIIKDTVGPKISGLSKITVDKGSKINYNKGVSAYDDNFGSCEYNVDSSNVNINKQGTYYAIYTSIDKLGNKTTSKRVVIINHDQSDTKALVKKVADGLSSNVEEIRNYVRNNIKYNTNWGGSDPIWYGLNNKVGNCLVHASIFEALLKEKGYSTKLIWTTDKTHYWNMVYLNGKWVHMDSTPGTRHTKYSIMNDEQRHEILQGRDWNRSLWPKAE